MSAIDELRMKKAELSAGGGAGSIQKQHEKGTLTARERLGYLFDRDTFVERMPFVEHRCGDFGLESRRFPGDGVVTGYGRVDGRTVFAFAQDFTVLGGSLGKQHAEKIAALQRESLTAGRPIVGLFDSGGARVQEGVDSLSGVADMFYWNTKSSGVIPQISAVMGPCAGGAAYSPALTDFIFMVERTSHMFITGPQVLSTVIGEKITAEKLGGADVQCGVSGVAQFKAANDVDCLMQIRELLGYLPSNNAEDPPAGPLRTAQEHPCAELDTIVPEDPRRSYNMKDVIRSLSDDKSFFEVHAMFAKNMITALTRIGGRTVGVVANQPNVLAGCLDIDASDKAARFVRTCDAFRIPLLTLVDVPGFLPGSGQEFGGIIRHGAKMLYSYSEATVPKLTVVLRKAYGGAYIAMCCRELGADEVYAWPSAEIAVMGPEGAANVVFQSEIAASPDPAEKRREMIETYKRRFAVPYTAAARGYVGDIIEPSQTRNRVIRALEVLGGKKKSSPCKKHGNIPL